MKLSIIIPVYNQEKLIKRCIDSIPRYEDMEIIVINDGSTDNTLEVLKEYKDIKLISYKTNKGVSYARNKGIHKAQGEYLLMIDSDDYIYEDIFKEIYENDLKIVDMIFFDMIDNNNEIYAVDKYRVMNRVGNFKFIRKDFIGLTRYKLNVQYGEDSIFHQALMCKSPTFIVTNKLMYHYNYPRVGSLTNIYKQYKES